MPLFLQKFCSGCFPLSCRLPFSPLGDTRSKRASDYLEAVSNDVLPRLRLCKRQTNVDERGSHSHQHSVQDKAGLDSSPHPHTEQERHRKGSQDRSEDAGLLAQEHEDGNEHCKDGCFDQKPRNHNPRPMNVLSHVARIYKEVQSPVLQKIDWVNCNSEIGSDRIRATDSPPQGGGVAAPQEKESVPKWRRRG